jgi:hypothetical protein
MTCSEGSGSPQEGGRCHAHKSTTPAPNCGPADISRLADRNELYASVCDTVNLSCYKVNGQAGKQPNYLDIDLYTSSRLWALFYTEKACI